MVCGKTHQQMKTIQRKTLAKKIRAATSRGDMESTRDAEDIANHGRPLTITEAKFSAYYSLKNAEQNCKLSDKLTGEIKKLDSLIVTIREQLVSAFVDAVENENSKAIAEMAEAVKFLKNRSKNLPPCQTATDPERSALLSLKVWAQEENRKFTIREVAEWVSMQTGCGKIKEQLDFTEDGFSALRRKCHEVGFPLAPSRQIRKSRASDS
jgi:hypothetical protein